MREVMITLADRETEWQAFYEYKNEKQHLSKQESEEISAFISGKQYMKLCEDWRNGQFPRDYPVKSFVNKGGTGKKRVVYTFDRQSGIFLKFIAFHLYQYDMVFEDNCYAFRRDYGVGDAIRRLKRNKMISKSYCLKVDISNYFNSIDVQRLLERLEFIKKDDAVLYQLFQRILLEDKVYEAGVLIQDNHGAMAGTPISPFLANVYLSHIDKLFKQMGVEYYRYSDDILIFAESIELLNVYRERLTDEILKDGLCLNQDKVEVVEPGGKIEFLGFSYEKGRIGISENTMRKVKRKIKRKADALRRWQKRKGLDAEKAAIGFVRAVNRIFYGREMESEFTWSRWFFPYITTTEELKELDKYIQQYIRYTVTGRHYKGNYHITYQQMKDWGYRNLVNEYYHFRAVREKSDR